jgi:choice-of-anchor B domain-containing protein
MKKIILLFILIPLCAFTQNSMNMNLLGTYDYPTSQGNDIWGWVDGNDEEYALVGLRSGFSVVNVTNPSSTIEEFFIPDINSIWRDIKTWGNYAYITTEADAGLLIVDLTDMTGNTFSHVSQFTNSNGGSISFTSAHDIYIDENGIAYIFGAGGPGLQPNGAIFLDVNANPTNPVYLGEWNDEYIHDGMVRGDTMWAGCVYDGKVFCVDVSDKTNPQALGSATTPNAFTHNAWVSDDGNYVFTTDEQSDSYLTAFDVSNLSNIFEVDRIQSNPGSNSIPHNTFVDGNFLITSYYRDGTTVHDITHPSYMIQVAYYDSYSGSGNGFDGCWGTYPYLPSGNIISSDINSGPGGSGRLLIYGRDFQQACYLKGTVTDGITSSPISNTSIEILSTTINENTNLIGFYQTASVNSGTFQVVFSDPGYTSDTLTVSLVNGVMTILDAVLFPPCNTFNIVTNNNVQICSDSSYVVGNSIYNITGTYSDTLTNYFGCDSVVNTNLIVNQPYSINNNETICDGQVLIVGSSQYSQSGIYTDILSSNSACDSTITTNLLVLPTSNFIQTLSFCSGNSIIVGSNIYTQTGIYTDILTSVNGCDSTITTDLTVFVSSSISNYQDICNGETYWIGNSYYTTPGYYTDIFTSVNGCDSVVNTNLTVYPLLVINNNYTICEDDIVIVGNNTYSQEGDYTDTLQTIYGCDSVINSYIQWSDPISSLTLAGTNIDASVSGGTSPFLFEIYGPSGLLNSTQNNGSIIQFNPLINGQYYFIVTDGLGCISDTAFININNIPSSISGIQNSKELIKIVDILGRETEEKRNTTLFFIYSDGTVEKKIIIE